MGMMRPGRLRIAYAQIWRRISAGRSGKRGNEVGSDSLCELLSEIVRALKVCSMAAVESFDSMLKRLLLSMGNFQKLYDAQ